MSVVVDLHQEDVTFQVGSDGRAHLAKPSTMTALCGFLVWQPAGDKGVPCQRCLDTAARLIIDTEERQQ